MILHILAIDHLKNKQKRFVSKYHQISKRLGTKYELIHSKITQIFYRETIETEIIRSKISSLITNSRISFESKIKPEKFIPVFSNTS